MSKSDREGRNTAWDHAERYEAQSLAARRANELQFYSRGLPWAVFRQKERL